MHFCPRCGSGPRRVGDDECEDCGRAWALDEPGIAREPRTVEEWRERWTRERARLRLERDGHRILLGLAVLVGYLIGALIHC